MSFLSDLGGWANDAVNNSAAVLTRDTGHAVNGALNVVGLGQYNPGSVLVDMSRSTANPGPILRLASGGASTPTTGPNIPTIDNKTGGNGTGSTIIDGNGDGSQYTPQELAAYNRWANKANSGLDQAKTSYDNSITQLGRDYAHQLNSLNSSRDQANADYQTGLDNAQANKLSNYNQARKQAQRDRRSLLNLISMYGNAGGSFATQTAPDLVRSSYQNNLDNANQVYGQNRQALDKSHNAYLNQYNQELGDLNTWRDKNKAQFKNQYNTTRSNLQDILSAINGRNGSADSLGSQLLSVMGGIPTTSTYKYAWSGKTPTYEAPDLSTYTMSPTELAAQAQASTGSNDSFLSPYMLDQRRRQEQGY